MFIECRTVIFLDSYLIILVMKTSKRAILGILCAALIYPLCAQTTGTLSFTCTTDAPSDTRATNMLLQYESAVK